MSLKFEAFQFTIFMFLVATFCLEFAAAVAGSQPVDPKDPAVIDTGKFAVYQYTKDTRTALHFRKVIGGTVESIVSNLKYNLTVGATGLDDLSVYPFEAVVLMDNKAKTKQLVSFKQLK